MPRYLLRWKLLSFQGAFQLFLFELVKLKGNFEDISVMYWCFSLILVLDRRSRDGNNQAASDDNL